VIVFPLSHGVPHPNHNRRRRRDHPNQEVFRFADEMRVSNESLAEENARLRAELALAQERLIEVTEVMENYARQIRREHRALFAAPPS